LRAARAGWAEVARGESTASEAPKRMAGSTTERLKLALIGCGARGLGVYAPALEQYATEHPDLVELTAACDTDGERADEAHRRFGFIAAADDVAAMVRDHCPAACICVLPAFDTMIQGSHLLAQNMPCLLELPLGESVDEMMEMSEAAGEANTPNMTALNRRFNPYLARASRWARQLGTIESITCSLTTPDDPSPAFFATTVVHAVDLLGHLLGRLGAFTVGEQSGATTITLPFDNGVTGTVAILPNAPEWGETYELVGPGFCAVATVLGAEGPSLRCWRGQLLEVDISGQTNQPEAAADGTYDLIAEFIGCLTAGGKLRPTIDDTMPAADLTFQIAADVRHAASV